MYRVECDSCQAVSVNGVATHERGCQGLMVYRRNGREYRRVTVWSLEAWGNPADGFEVNDASRVGSVMLPINASDREIIRRLKVGGFLRKGCHSRSFSVSGDYRCVQIDTSKTGEPLYSLEFE